MRHTIPQNFIDIFDNLFQISCEMIAGCGEDNYFSAHNESSAIVSVYDGCGGLGSRTYEAFQGHTGAYMASRAVSGAVCDWYHANSLCTYSDCEALKDSLLEYIQRGYQLCGSYAVSNLRIRGSMVRDLPTTAAIAFAQYQSGHVRLYVAWAGDSRVYLLDQNGLAQLTADDVESEDALSNLSNDGALTNLLSSDGKFILHTKQIDITEPTIVFAATDGCFGYIPSPMEFEYMILENLQKSATPIAFRDNLDQEIQTYAGDDYTLGLMSFYFGSFRKMKDFFKNRTMYIEQNYMQLLPEEQDNDLMNNLWEEYRADYERYL